MHKSWVLNPQVFYALESSRFEPRVMEVDFCLIIFPFNLVILRFQPGVYAMLKIGSSIHESFEFVPPESTSPVSVKTGPPNVLSTKGSTTIPKASRRPLTKKRREGLVQGPIHMDTHGICMDDFCLKIEFSPNICVAGWGQNYLYSVILVDGQLSRQRFGFVWWESNHPNLSKIRHVASCGSDSTLDFNDLIWMCTTTTTLCSHHLQTLTSSRNPTVDQSLGLGELAPIFEQFRFTFKASNCD